MNALPVVFLMGPTAAGKTDVAVKLVERFPFEIISVDSAMIYRGLNIGTAKPDSTILQNAPHRLIDIRDPAAAYSAAEFRRDAIREIGEIHALGKIPLLVGGTMLYFRVLESGLSPLPEASPQIRQALQQRLQVEGLSSLYAELQQVDPDAVQRIHAHDPQRILRALEVFIATGEPMSDIINRTKGDRMPFKVLKLALITEERHVLHERIERRFYKMLDAGFVNEVEALRERGDLNLEKTSIRTVGYRQVWQYLDGMCTYDDMVQRGIFATRQLAKRQLTWLRSVTELHPMDGINLDMDGLHRLIEAFLPSNTR